MKEITMETIKSFTDIEQSKKLAEILPTESADMHYHYDNDFHELESIPTITEEDDHFILFPEDVRCWSLAALLNLLPNNEHIETTISRGSWKIDTVEYLPNTWWCEYEDTENQTEFNISADNPIDACYEMIVNLHEMNLL